MVYCSTCGTQNREGSKFCNNCGARLKPRSGAICPMCSTPNQVESVFCSNCGARLVPLTAATSAPSPEKPAHAPPPPIKGLTLPAKPPAPVSSAPDEASADAAPVPDAVPSNAAPVADQGSIPDVTSVPDVAESPTEPQVQSFPAEAGEPALPVTPESVPAPDVDNGLPDWLRDLRSTVPVETNESLAAQEKASETTEQPAQPEPAQEDVPDWLARLRTAPPVEEEPSGPSATSSETPDWVKRLQSQEPTEAAPQSVGPLAEPTAPEDETPDWLKQLSADAGREPAPDTAAPPGWLNTQGETPTRAEPASGPSAIDQEAQVPDWLQQLSRAPTGEQVETPDQSQIPPWLQQVSPEPSDFVTPAETEQAPARPEEPTSPQPISALEQPAQAEEQMPPLPAPVEPQIAPAAEEELPDWVRQMRAAQGQAAESAGQGALSAGTVESAEAKSPATVGAEAEPVSPDIEEIPDWLRLAMPANEAAEAASGPSATAPSLEGEPAEQEPAVPSIEPARPEEVPAWVAALKPKQDIAPKVAGQEAEAAETAGLLAGLRGALPVAVAVAEPHKDAMAGPGAEPASGAHLFESILAEQAVESEAPPAAKRPRVWTMRPLIYALLLLAVILPLALPGGLASYLLDIRGTPAETFYDRIQILPQNSVVLVAFDYDPSVAGEMDLQANAIVRDLVRRRIKLVAVSTLVTGPPVAQRILTNATANSGYVYGTDYLNAGYLPGDQIGLAQIAANGLPLTNNDYVNNQSISLLPIAANVKSLRDVKLVIELAGSEETLKLWMEQIQAKSSTPVAAGVSAGVEPKARVYLAAGQLVAMLSGLAGAAQYEILSSQPGRAVTSVGAQSAAQLVLILILLIGNIQYWMSRRQRNKTVRATGGKAT